MTAPFNPELEPNPNPEQGVREAIEVMLRDPKSVLDLAREMAADNPRYSRQSRLIAYALYPNDPALREAFMSGSELPFAIRRQQAEGIALEELVNGPAEPEKPKRRLFKRRERPSAGRQVAALTVGALVLPLLRSKPSQDGPL